MLPCSLDPGLRGKVLLGGIVLEGVVVRPRDEALQAEMAALAADLKGRYAAVPSGDIPGVSEARGLYKALGLDPTKTRPSNEALLRRALKGEVLRSINSLVDALNLCSLRHQLPFGLYDLDRVKPPIVLRLGAPGESYEGIGKGAVHVGGRPVLADEEGAFGNPSSDSFRTRVTLETRRALATVYAPGSWSRPKVEKVLSDASATLRRHSQGTEGGLFLVGG